MRRISGPVALALSALAIIVVAVVGWYVLISPQRSKASDLDTQISAVQTQLADAQHLLAAPNRRQTQAALVAARRALPDTPRMSAILRQLSKLVASSSTELDSITPGALIPAAGAEPLPISLSMKGRYFAIQKFVKLLRQSADLKGKTITGNGRLYSIDTISFAGSGANAAAQNGQNGLISATIALNTYVYSSVAPPPPVTTTTTAANVSP